MLNWVESMINVFSQREMRRCVTWNVFEMMMCEKRNKYIYKKKRTFSACTQEHIHVTQPLMHTVHTEITCGKWSQKMVRSLIQNQFLFHLLN